MQKFSHSSSEGPTNSAVGVQKFSIVLVRESKFIHSNRCVYKNTIKYVTTDKNIRCLTNIYLYEYAWTTTAVDALSS